MFIRKVFKLSSYLKNIPLTSQTACAYHLSHVENLKGIEDVTENAKDTDRKFLLDLKSPSISKVLITLQNNKELLQGTHIVMAMSSFYHLIRKESNAISGDHSESVNIKWKEHSFVKEMIGILEFNIDKLSGPEAVQILYYTKKLKGTNKIVKTLIQYIQKNIKELSLDDFKMIVSLFKRPDSFLYLLGSYEDLEKAMMKDFIMRASMNHQRDNIDYLVNGMYFLCCNSERGNNELLQSFVEDLCNYNKDIPVEKVFLIHDSLLFLRYYPERWSELFEKVQQIIIQNIDDVNVQQIKHIVISLASQMKSVNGPAEFYDAAFIDKLIEKMISDDVGFESALSVLKHLITIRHYNVEILNYVCATYFDRKILKNEHISNLSGKLLTMLSGLAHANHKSIFWTEVENYFLSEKNLLNYSHVTLCILSLNAACLDCYPTEILRKVFDNSYDFSKDSFLHWTFAKLYQKIQINSSYDGPRPTEFQIESLNAMLNKSLISKKQFPVLIYLQEAVGGSTYVKTRLRTNLFHIIDHVVAFDKDDLPIPINSENNIDGKTKNVEYLEDIQVPTGSKKVAVILSPPVWYFRNTNKLMGPYAVFKESLEKLNVNVVDINFITWSEIPDEEKTPFLQSLIKSTLKTATLTT